MAAASALAPAWAEQLEPADSATSQPVSARIATFEEVWRTVRDRFYDPHLNGLDWSAVRERYLPDATRASSEEALASVTNSMLSELHASHTRYYTRYEPEYYQLSDIFAGALRRRGLERAFPGGRISYPGIGILSRLDMQGHSVITGVIERTPAQQAGLLAGVPRNKNGPPAKQPGPTAEASAMFTSGATLAPCISGRLSIFYRKVR